MYCKKLVQIEFPSLITQLSHWDFAFCSNIITTTIPSSVRLIRKIYFKHCSFLSKAEFLNPSLYTDEMCFKDCGALE
ncbi:MAG: leucine-rich repeat domain-containing protein [Oscillospiraceae bacterium]|nr:leucine-rich repeat domain-containing protein [Oscillospiraceae bacterium]